ncbi:MAG: DUF402 domain-containing protein [Actinomycetota bacterium]
MWQPGELVRRRELLGLSPVADPEHTSPWDGTVWLELPLYVVVDEPDRLVTYLAPETMFTFPSPPAGTDRWPAPGGVHPWSGRDRWQGHGCLMLHEPGANHAIWHFWSGEDRVFSHWYVNLQTAFVRTADGFDSQDLELDFIVWPDGSWEMKDYELLDERVAEGRSTPALRTWLEEQKGEFSAALDRGDRWWDTSWAEWEPPEGWVGPAL